jgi:8-oxo-dGTP pyrophosphatase MutT (NUDIX family)
MTLIKEIDLNPEIKCNAYRLRKRAGAILFNDKNEVAVLYVGKHDYYRLGCGGGIEDGEDIESALHREAMEEIGAKIEVIGDLGITIEYHKQWHNNLSPVIVLSYCYIAKVVGDLGKQDFTIHEKEHGFALEWHSIDKAISLMSLPVTDYHGKMYTARDLALLDKFIRSKTIDLELYSRSKK